MESLCERCELGGAASLEQAGAATQHDLGPTGFAAVGRRRRLGDRMLMDAASLAGSPALPAGVPTAVHMGGARMARARGAAGRRYLGAAQVYILRVAGLRLMGRHAPGTASAALLCRVRATFARHCCAPFPGVLCVCECVHPGACVPCLFTAIVDRRVPGSAKLVLHVTMDSCNVHLCIRSWHQVYGQQVSKCCKACL